MFTSETMAMMVWQLVNQPEYRLRVATGCSNSACGDLGLLCDSTWQKGEGTDVIVADVVLAIYGGVRQVWAASGEMG